MSQKLPTDFYQRVYEVVLRIPYGRVSTYGHIATYLGMRGSSRMVGYALTSSNKLGLDVPAHRVVNRNGLLTGKNHFGHPDMMASLLEAEGVQVVDDQVQEFAALLWIP
jgi:methylated-DNA-protein-cysteine methyltransferase related protein